MIRKISLIILAGMFLLPAPDAYSRGLFRKKPAPQPQQTEQPRQQERPDPNAPQPYRQVITPNAKTVEGFFTTHYINGRYFFEIPDSLLGRDLLIVNRIIKAPADRNKQAIGYPGDHLGDGVIRFEKGPQNKMFIREISYLEFSSDTLGLYQSVLNSNVQPIVAQFDIKAYGGNADNRSSVIDMTDYIRADRLFSIDASFKRNMGVGNMMQEGNYIDTVKTFPTNIEVRNVKTFQRAQNPQSPSMNTTPLTYELNTSLLLLPEKPMKARLYDPRVGYFAVRYTDFDSNPQGVDVKAKITRWRLEPKEEDIEKYLAGELVEPKKPIVIYIDPATPKQWVPYLIAGVNDWQSAFEHAGFKNAIYALEAPDDPEWSLEDARHSAIVYKPSDIPNASGPHVHDPRSGEIMETHINWYHNVMSLLRNWYMVQAGPLDKRAQQIPLPEDLMGELIRFVSSHEVGHTLGLRHNFGSSATVPVEKLRDKEWVEANGHTPSIMDYARFNYIAQPEDNIGDAGIFPRIGLWDNWAIEWGYRWLPQFETPEDELAFSNQDIINRLAQDVRYTFGTETDPDDPRNQNEDLGDDAMLAGYYGILNLKRIVPNILDWTYQPNKGYSEAESLYQNVVEQFDRYMGHARKNIGGIYRTPRTVEENAPAEEFVPAEIQQRAMDFLAENLFKTPMWLINDELVSKTGQDPVGMVGWAQARTLTQLLTKRTIDKLSRNEIVNGPSAYTNKKLFSDLRKAIWGELNTYRSTDIYRRSLQKYYVNALINLADKKPGTQTQQQGGGRTQSLYSASAPSDAAVIARQQLTELNRDLKRAAANTSGETRYHYQNLSTMIESVLEMK